MSFAKIHSPAIYSGFIVSAHCAMEHGQLLSSALTCLPSRNAYHPASQIETPIHTCHNNLSVHLAMNVWHSRRITDGMQSVWTTLWDSVLSSPTPAHTHSWNLPTTEWVQLNHLHTGISCFCSCLNKWGMAPFITWVWQRRTNPWPCHPLMSNPLTTPWTMAWLFWMRQLNGYSTSAPRSTAAK